MSSNSSRLISAMAKSGSAVDGSDAPSRRGDKRSLERAMRDLLEPYGEVSVSIVAKSAIGAAAKLVCWKEVTGQLTVEALLATPLLLPQECCHGASAGLDPIPAV